MSGVAVNVAGVAPIGVGASGRGTPNGNYTLRFIGSGDDTWEVYFNNGTALGDPHRWWIHSHCTDGEYYVAVISLAYGPIGGGIARLGHPIPLDGISGTYTAGTVTPS